MESKANPLDLIHNEFYENEEHDRMLRCLLTFQQLIGDTSNFHKTLAKILRFIPFINCLLNQNPNGEFVWVAREENTSCLLYTYTDYSLFYREYLAVTDPMNYPPIKILICGDTIGFVANNMFMDGYALKHFMAIFFDEYNHINDPAFVSPLYATQTRSFDKFINSIPKEYKMGKAIIKPNGVLQKFKSLIKLPEYSNPTTPSHSGAIDLRIGYNEHQLVFSPLNNTVAPWLNYEHIKQETLVKLKRIAAKEGVALNDIITAAYIRSIAKYLNAYNQPISVGRFYNARTESSIPNYRSFSNLHVVLPNFASVTQNGHFHNTILQINAISKKIKDDHLVAKQICLPPKQIIGQTEYFQIADYGEFKSNFFNIKNNKVVYVFFTPAMRNTPYIAIATAEYENNLFISCANYCNEKDLEIIKVILAEMIVEINCYIYAMELLGQKRFVDVTPQINNYYYENAIKIFDHKLHQFIKEEVTITEKNNTKDFNDSNHTTFTGVLADEYNKNESVQAVEKQNKEAPAVFLSEQDFQNINNNFDNKNIINQVTPTPMVAKKVAPVVPIDDVDTVLQSFATLSDLNQYTYNSNPNFKPIGNYNNYGWVPQQIALAVKFEELTGFFLAPLADQPAWSTYTNRNNAVVNRLWIDIMKYVHYKVKK